MTVATSVLLNPKVLRAQKVGPGDLHFDSLEGGRSCCLTPSSVDTTPCYRSFGRGSFVTLVYSAVMVHQNKLIF